MTRLKTMDGSGSGILGADHKNRCTGGGKKGHCDSSIDASDEDEIVKK